MADASSGPTNDLGERLRRWIVIAGYILGAWAILETALTIAAWGLPFNRGFRFWFLVPIHEIALVAMITAPPLLVIGCWGFQQHRRWSRPVLLTYAGMWIVSIFGAQIVQFIDTLSGTYGGLTFRQLFSIAMGELDTAVYASVFPALLVLCLLRPEIRHHFPEFKRGFAPVITGESDDASGDKL